MNCPVTVNTFSWLTVRMAEITDGDIQAAAATRWSLNCGY